MAIDYVKFNRLVERIAEIAGAPGVSPVLATVYQHTTMVPLSRFATAHVAVDNATSRHNLAAKGLETRLEDMSRHSNTALAVLAIVQPQTKLPDPLKSQPTDTDQRQMLQRLLGILGDHAGEAWADALLQGDFGTQAPEYVQFLTDSIQAGNDLQAARKERAESFDPAWQAFVGYKRLVRSFFGPAARQYKRLHVRTVAGGEEDEAPPEEGEAPLPEEGEAPEPTPATVPVPVPAPVPVTQ